MQVLIKIISSMAEILSIIVRNVLLIVLWSSIVPFDGKRTILAVKSNRSSKYRNFLLPFIMVLVAEFIIWGFSSFEFPVWIIAAGLVMLGHAFVCDKEKMPGTIFAFTLYVNFRCLSYFVVDTSMKLVMQAMFEGIHEVQNPEQYVTIWVGFFEKATYVLYALVLLAEVLIFRRLLKSGGKINWIECGYLSVLNIAGFFLTMIMMRLAVMKVGEELFILTDIRPELLWQMPVISLLIYLGEMAVIYAWQEYSRYRKQSELYMVEAMEKDAIKKRLEDTQKYYEDVRRTRHEMASHMTAIKGLAANGNIDEMNEYIEHLDDSISTIIPGANTGNPVTDVVIGDRRRKAQEAGIAFTVNFEYSSEWKIPVYDLSIVISNLLDNAIRAAGELPDEKKYISLQAVERGSVVLLICKNAYDPFIKHEKREDEEWHGFGLKNVREIAERYEGGLQIQKSEKEFTAMVMMKK